MTFEGEKELSTKIQFKLAASATLKGKSVMELVRPFTPVFIYVDMGDGFQEVTRGTIQKYGLIESNSEFYLDLEAADETQALRHNQDHFFFFTEDHGSTAIVEEILNKWGVPHEIQITDVKHAKKVYNNRYLSDMLTDVLKDIKEKDSGVYFIRAKDGVIQIIPRGTNETVYHFDVASNLVRVNESFDVSNIVTRVLVVAKSREEGHQSIEATVDGKTEYGTRQVIYTRPDKESLEEAEKAAKKILDEQGDVKRKTSVEAPDLPTFRKGDRVRIGSSVGEGYFFVKSIRHNAVSQKMTFELDEDKEKNKSVGVNYDTGAGDESNSSAPP
ncbi:MAG: hypothetical protein II968_02360 [Selenomonadaceae bacterium]|nr:hypothetical protein [Selenomonadaceae bacterium]